MLVCALITTFDSILWVSIGTLHDRDTASLQQKILTFVRLLAVLISFVLVFFDSILRCFHTVD